MEQPLLTTKLFIPQLSEKHITRKNLLKKLIAGYQNNNQLTLICAPAGYGKTTLALEFINSLPMRSAWLSLDDGDNDLHRFLLYFCEAIRNAGVNIADDVTAMISDAGIQNMEHIITLVINCVTEYQEKVTLTFDDFHIIHALKVKEIFKFIIDHQPPNLHLILISREDPQLPLARLRMKNKLTEIRIGELLFTNDEATEFFHLMNGISINDQSVEKVNQRTEGWVAGIVLAALLLNGYEEDQMEDFLHKFDGTNHYIIDYLVEEVLEHQEKDLREFLCKTSILERMNERLCNEITGRLDSKDILMQMEKKNLFLIPLDDKKEWYRYHHLFADSLKTFLTEEEEESTLYIRASVWMKQNGYSNEAVRYAFKSKDIGLAVKMVEDSTQEIFINAQIDSFLNWLELLPEELIKQNEILCIRKGIALLITGKWMEGIKYIDTFNPDQIEQLSNQNKGLLLIMRAMQANVEGRDAEPIAKEALQFLEPWDPIAITSTLNTLGRAQCQKGNFSEASLTFKKAYESGMKIGYQFVTTLALMNYSACLQLLGSSEEALSLCNHYVDMMKKKFHKLPTYIGVLYCVMADLYSENNDQEKAISYHDTGMQLCRSISFDVEGSLILFRRKNDEQECIHQSGLAADVIELNYGEKLSEREIEILRLLIRGLSNKEIADTLFIAINTTQWHLSHIYSKLGVKSRTQAMLKAKELGLI